jgi:fatty acid desaturase
MVVAHNAPVIDSYEALRAEADRLGCFEPAPLRSALSLLLHLLATAALWWASARISAWWASPPLFIVGSFLFYRIGWIMHDAAHGGVFRSAAADRRFAALAAAILGEFPSGWRYGHNRHHAAPNVRGRDMDQSERWDPERRYTSMGTAFVGLLLFSRFKGRYLPKTLLLLGLRDGFFCYRHHPAKFRQELLGVLAGFGLQLGLLCALFGWIGPLLFLAHTTIGMLYLNTVFAGNHYDLDSFDEDQIEGIPFADLQIRTTRNYAGGLWARFVFGGMEHQIEHHLFPQMPRRGLRRVAPLVRAFCQARGLPYRVEPFWRTIHGVLRFHIDPA